MKAFIPYGQSHFLKVKSDSDRTTLSLCEVYYIIYCEKRRLFRKNYIKWSTIFLEFFKKIFPDLKYFRSNQASTYITYYNCDIVTFQDVFEPITLKKGGGPVGGSKKTRDWKACSCLAGTAQIYEGTVKRTFLANVEAGDSSISIDTLVSLCQSLSCSSDSLLFGEEINPEAWKGEIARLQNFPIQYQPQIRALLQSVAELILSAETKSERDWPNTLSV